MSGWTLLDPMTWTAFGWAVIHFIWQGALIGLVTVGVLECMRGRPATWRYTTACVALGLCLVTFLGTFFLLASGARSAVAAVAVAPMASEAFEFTQSDSTSTASGLTTIGSIAMTLWFIGFILMTVRFLVQWRSSRRLARTAVTTPDACWCTLFEDLKRELRLAPSIRLLQSGLVQTPMVVGWLSPVVLVPAEVFTSLNREQLKLVLLHELSHLRRMDHLINLVQGVIECLLFFHPVTWWLSSQIRIEREHCCDALTLENHDQPRVFAEALFTLERLRLARTRACTQTTLHATGGTLMSRITRLLELETAIPSRSAWRTPLAIALSSMVAAGCLVNLDASAGAAAPMVQQEQSAEGSFPTTESMRNELQAEIDRGHLSEEQAIQIARIHERLLMALETGRVDTEQALKILEERAGAVYENAAEEARGQVRASMATADYDEAVSKMLRMVKSGEITEEQMQQRLERMKGRMGGSQKSKAPSKVEYMEAEKKMAAMVKTGEITEEQMQQRLGRMKQMMEQTPRFTKADYEAAVKKMTAMVKSGEITREQMEQRLSRMKQMMEQTPRFTKADYEAAVKQMTAMVKSGEITREQMEQRLSRMKQMMEQTPRFTKADYEAAAKKMAAMVESGEITRKQMEQRLEGMKQRMQAAKSSVSTADYAKAEADMAKMVEAGTITREQMEQRLARMRALMAASEMNGRGAKKAKRALPTPPEGLSRMELREWYQRVAERLDMAVESGRMSVDEKDAMLEKIKASLRK